jgi:hypothetical protein
MVTYNVVKPRPAMSTHAGTNKDPELYALDRRLQDKHLFKSGTPKWRDPNAPSNRGKLKDTWLHGADYVDFCIRRAMKRKQQREEKGE